MGEHGRGSGQYQHIPIPTYDEAITSRPTSSQNLRGAAEVSDDAERQGLLREASGHVEAHSRRRDGYQPPTVESARNSTDSDLDLPEVLGEQEEASLRRDMEEMELDDSAAQRSNFSKHFTFSYIRSRLPSLPSFRFCSGCTCAAPQGFDYLPMIVRLAGIAIIGMLIWIVIRLTSRGHIPGLMHRFDPESVRQTAQEEADAGRIAESLRYITSFDHVAGTEGDLYLARWVQEQFNTARLDDVGMEDFHVYLNYPTPTGRKVSIVDPPQQKWSAPLEEDNVFRFSGEARTQTLNWHGHSRNGSATGHLVYANGGSRDDFAKLKEMGVKVEGSIALMRQYHTQESMSLKVLAAQQAGAVGCILYSDPKETGSTRGKVFPDGPWQQKDAVQRGGVGLTDWVLGDPLTPGYASTEKANAKSELDNPGLVKIPSLSLSWDAAFPLLLSLQTHGKQVPADWVGDVPKVESWWTGAEDSPKVLVENIQDENKKQRIWNVHGTITGMESNSRVVVGNNRDSWCFGATDPGSGTAVMLEVVHILGVLRGLGWAPLRTIEFQSWDAKEFGMMGSTEHVEADVKSMRTQTLSYLNVGAGISGTQFRAAGSPELTPMLLRVLERINDPEGNKTIRDVFLDRHGKIELLDANGDYAAWQNIAGATSLDFGFTGPTHGYPARSCYDTYDWMEKFGDPDFDVHKALAQIWVLIILELADKPIVPFDLRMFASRLKDWISDLNKDTKAFGLDFGRIIDASKKLADAAAELHKFEDTWTSIVMGRGGFETDAAGRDRVYYNEKMLQFQKELLDIPKNEGDKEQHGIPGREQYKHVIFGPQLWSSRNGADTFAAVRDAVEAKDKPAAQKHLDKAATLLGRAADVLVVEAEG